MPFVQDDRLQQMRLGAIWMQPIVTQSFEHPRLWKSRFSYNIASHSSWISLCCSNCGIHIGWLIQKRRLYGTSFLAETLLHSLKHIRIWTTSTTVRQRVSQGITTSSNMQTVY